MNSKGYCARGLGCKLEVKSQESCMYLYIYIYIVIYQEQAPLSCKLLLFLFHIVKRMLLAAIGVAPGPNDLDSKPLNED